MLQGLMSRGLVVQSPRQALLLVEYVGTLACGMRRRRIGLLFITRSLRVTGKP